MPMSDDHDELEASMTLKPLKVPEKTTFRGYILEEEIPDLTKRDRKTVVKMSIMEQWNDWQTQKIVELWEHGRKIEADLARRRKKESAFEQEQKEQGWKWAILKWIGVVSGAAILSALFRWLFDKLP